jgi:hypothetical protein
MYHLRILHRGNEMHSIVKAVLLLSLAALPACTANTKGSASPVTSNGNVIGTYSSYGGGVEFNESKGLYYVDVFVGGGGNLEGAKKYAAADIAEFGRKKGFTTHEIVDSDYSFFPLSKYRLYVTYR